MGIHIVIAVPQFQYQLIHLVGKPVQRGLEFYQQVAGDNDGEAYCVKLKLKKKKDGSDVHVRHAIHQNHLFLFSCFIVQVCQQPRKHALALSTASRF